MHAFNVVELFNIKGRGVVVATDKTSESLSSQTTVKIGDEVEFRRDGRIILKTRIIGIEHFDPWTPKQPLAFLVPPDVITGEVEIGAEIWLCAASLLPD